MKKLLLSIVLATSLTLTSCKFDDSDIWGKLDEYGESIKDHEERISALEELCKQMNTNISALQTLVDALEKRDYITNISPIYKDGEEIGYTISFAYSGTITIYHGTNGKDGVDGNDGYTPQIGVAQDADGFYYWTLDGEWLLDSNGNKIKAVGTDGKDGANGSNGSNGTNGNDGITPRLKIDNDYWYVSYDNGATWQQLGKATGEDGKDGNDGADSIIIGIEETETEVIFTLSDNTTITIPKHAKSSLADPDDICTAMDDVKFMEYCYQNFDVNKDGKVSPVEAKSVRSIDISGLEIYSIKGVEYFEILESLIAENTLLRNADISFNNKLISFSFKGCSGLTSFSLPENFTTIAASAFYGCTNLTSITIPDSVTSIGGSAFYGCTGELIINSKIVEIDYGIDYYSPTYNSDDWLYGSKFTKLTIGDNIEKIGSCAFYGCSSLTSVTIPNSVTSIGSGIFANCSSMTAFYGKFASTDNRYLVVDGVLNSFAPAGLTEYIIPNSVTGIGYCAFKGCSNLTSVIIPDSVTSIGYYAFEDCNNLTSVKIPDSIASIGYCTFSGCSSLTSVIIPNSVTSIGKYAFRSCSLLTSVNISDLLAWCKIDFSDHYANPLYYGAKLYINGVETTEIIIPSDITEIKSYTFTGCGSLTSITIPNSIDSIGECAFSDCAGELIINSKIVETDYTYYDSPMYSNTGWLYGSKFTKLIIGDNIEKIGNYAFHNCSSLTSVIIPNSVTSIGEYAFRSCSLLTSVYCKATTPPIGGNNMFGGYVSGRKIYVPTASLDAYKTATYWESYASYIIGYDFE